MVSYNKQAIPFKAGGVDVGGCVWESICLKARLHRVGVCTCQRVDVGQWMCGRVNVRGLIDVWEVVSPEARLHRVDVGRWMWVPQLTGLYMPCPQRNLAMIS